MTTRCLSAVLAACAMLASGVTLAEEEDAQEELTSTIPPLEACENCTREDEPLLTHRATVVEDCEDCAAQEEESSAAVRKPRFLFKVNVVPRGGVECSRDMETGSHTKDSYCRSEAQAYLERRAAQEFLQEAMRNSGN